MEAREALGHPHAAEHVRSGGLAGGRRRQGPRRRAARCGSASASSGSTAGTSTSTAPASSSRRCRWTTPRSSAAAASYEGAKESLLRLKSIGINFVYTHNYGCEPGSHLGFEEILRAADDVGMLVAFSQPHFGHYDWKMPDADAEERLRPPRRVLRPRGGEPSVGGVLLDEPQRHRLRRGHEPGPDRRHPQRPRASGPRTTSSGPCGPRRSSRGSTPAASSTTTPRATSARCTPATSTPNLAPIQELDDWFEHWATEGVKPVFTCEYMVPFTWDWTMYRGWYKGSAEFGSAAVPWEFCLAEWNAQFLGDRAFQISEPEKKNLRWEAEQFRDGKLWHRWDYPYQVGSTVFDEPARVIGAVPHRQLAGLPHLGRLGHLALGTPLLLEPARRRRQEPQGAQGRLGEPAAARVQPGLHRRAVRTHGPGLRALRLDPDRRRAGPPAQQPAAAGLPRRQAGGLHQQGPQLLARRDGREAAHRHQQLARDGDLRLPVVARPCRKPVGRRRRKVDRCRPASRSGFRCACALPAGAGAGHVRTERRRSGSATARRRRTRFTIHVLPQPGRSPVGRRRSRLFDPKGETAALLAAMGSRSASRSRPSADLAGYDVARRGQGGADARTGRARTSAACATG